VSSTKDRIDAPWPSAESRHVEVARELIRLREQMGVSRDRLPYEMRRAGIREDRVPSPKTLYRVEELGREPRIGIKAGLAEFYGVDLHVIWPPREPRCAREAA